MLNLEQQIFHQINQASNILVVYPGHEQEKRDNGDSLASSLALYLFLKKIGKRVDIANQSNTGSTQPLAFLPGYIDIQKNLPNLRRFVVSVNIGDSKIHNIKYTVDSGKLNFIISPVDGWFKPEDVSAQAGEFKYDLILSIGASDLESLGKIYDDNIEFFYKTTIINIDHRATNEEFGQINFIDLNAIASSEIIYYLLKNYRPKDLDENIATCLLAGIIQQTRNFKTTNLTPRTLLTTSELIDCGGRREEIVDHLYRARSLSALKLWGKILNNLQTSREGALLWSTIEYSENSSSLNNQNILDDLVDELIISVPNAKLIAIISDKKTEGSDLHLYSLKNINALDVIKNHKPLGSSRAAHASIKGGMKESAPILIGELERYLDKLTS